MSHGTLRKTRRAQPETIPAWGVFIIESHHEEGFEMDTRVHDFMKILSVVGGAGRIHLAGKPVPMTEGDAVIVPPGTPNRVEDEPGKPMSLYVLCVAPNLWQADPNLLARLGTGRLALRQAARQRLGALMRRLLFEQSRSAGDGALPMVSLALQTILLLLEAPRPTGAHRPA